MGSMTRAGCGLELAAGATRGRPARFDNATCRQRARRARLASKNAELLAAVIAAETALSELRRIVVADEQLPAGVDRRLQQAVSDLADRLRGSRPAPDSAAGTDA
jgi:hypothetical protein